MDFRFKALQKMREPDELDSPTLLAAPRGWVAVFVVLIVTVGAGVWAFAGHLPLTVSATGLLTHPLGVATVQSPYSGVVTDVRVVPGQTIASNQPLVWIAETSGAVRQLSSPFPGVVIAVSVNGGQVVPVGGPVVSVERTDAPHDRLLAMLFVPADQATGVRPGAVVQLAVSSAPPQAFGLLRGRVTSITPYLLTADALDGLLGDPLAVRTFAPLGAPRLVIVDLTPDPATGTGYAWTTRRGPPFRLQSQTRLTGAISLGDRRPIDFVLDR
jgi:multidrug efflux pump subunit AcrA (membrane-fusion protein)